MPSLTHFMYDQNLLDKHITSLAVSLTRGKPHLDVQDLRNYGWVKALDILPGWDPNKGELGAYIHTPVKRSMISYILRVDSPVKYRKSYEYKMPQEIRRKSYVESFEADDLDSRLENKLAVVPNFEYALDCKYNG